MYCCLCDTCSLRRGTVNGRNDRFFHRDLRFDRANQVYNEQGYSFVTRVGGHFDSNTSPANPIVPGVPYLVFHESANNLVNNLITLTFGGAAFDFLGFDLIYDTPILTFNPIFRALPNCLDSGFQNFLICDSVSLR